ALIDDIRRFTGANSQSDDITLLEITCQPVELTHAVAITPAIGKPTLPWQISMKLAARDLRQGSPVSQLIDMLGTTPELERHKDYLHTILTELFSNALEHGVLGMTSELKETEHG